MQRFPIFNKLLVGLNRGANDIVCICILNSQPVKRFNRKVKNGVFYSDDIQWQAHDRQDPGSSWTYVHHQEASFHDMMLSREETETSSALDCDKNENFDLTKLFEVRWRVWKKFSILTILHRFPCSKVGNFVTVLTITI